IYKRVRRLPSVRAAFVDAQITYLLRHAPNSRMSGIYQIASLTMLAIDPSYGKKPISSGYVERISLSTGGSYCLTTAGEDRARRVAQDMIRRA
ncbi:MAG: hypothetical protein WA926_03275, partial [Methylovirgula sp.]